MSQPAAAPHSLDVAPEYQQAMVHILEEQRRAVAYLCANPGDRGARQWLDDWIAEEVLLRRSIRGQGVGTGVS